MASSANNSAPTLILANSTQEYSYILSELKLAPNEARLVNLKSIEGLSQQTLYHDMGRGDTRNMPYHLVEAIKARRMVLKHYTEHPEYDHRKPQFERMTWDEAMRDRTKEYSPTLIYDEMRGEYTVDGKVVPKELIELTQARAVNSKDGMAILAKMMQDAARMQDAKSDYTPFDEKPKPPKKEHMILLAGSSIEAKEFAEAIGVTHEYVSGFLDMRNYQGKTIYIVGTALSRPDYPAIEGLFLQFNCTVIDLEADA